MHPYNTPISDETRAKIAAHLASLPSYVPLPPLIPGQIQLDANPDNAPCCVRIEAHDGRDLLIQTDWDWPGVASAFGWDIASCNPDGVEEGFSCKHDGTDGTIDCPACGMKAGRFLEIAREWIDCNDGAIAEDPGYFA